MFTRLKETLQDWNIISKPAELERKALPKDLVGYLVSEEKQLTDQYLVLFETPHLLYGTKVLQPDASVWSIYKANVEEYSEVEPLFLQSLIDTKYGEGSFYVDAGLKRLAGKYKLELPEDEVPVAEPDTVS